MPEGNSSDAAERGEIAPNLFQPVGAERISEVSTAAQCKQDGSIHTLGLAFAHLLGHFGKDPSPKRQNQER